MTHLDSGQVGQGAEVRLEEACDWLLEVQLAKLSQLKDCRGRDRLGERCRVEDGFGGRLAGILFERQPAEGLLGHDIAVACNGVGNGGIEAVGEATLQYLIGDRQVGHLAYSMRRPGASFLPLPR